MTALFSEHVLHGPVQCLATVEHEQHAPRGVKAPISKASHEGPYDRRVLCRALHHPEGDLQPVCAHPERSRHGVAREVEAIREHDEEPVRREVPGAELQEAGRGRGHEALGDRRGGLGASPGLHALADRFEPG